MPAESVSAVNYHVAEGVAVLTIANPPVNALSLPVREALLAALRRAEADPAVRAIVLTGADGMFAAGADLNEVASGLVLKPPITRDVQAQIESLTKPLVAAIEGLALGGGFELALTCHWRLAGARRQGRPAGGEARPHPRRRRYPALHAPRRSRGRARGHHLRRAAAGRAGARAGSRGRGGRSRAAGRRWCLRGARRGREAAAARRERGERAHPRRCHRSSSAAFRRKLEPKARGQLAPWRIIDGIEAACTRPKEEALRLRARVLHRVSRQPAAPGAAARVLRRARGAQDSRHPQRTWRRCRSARAGGDRCGHHGRRHRHDLRQRRHPGDAAGSEPPRRSSAAWR